MSESTLARGARRKRARSSEQDWPPAVFEPGCTRCPRLAAHLESMRTSHPDYYNAPVGPFGDPAAKLVIVGLAPGAHGANATGRPFTGDHAGLLLYRTLHDLKSLRPGRARLHAATASRCGTAGSRTPSNVCRPRTSPQRPRSIPAIAFWPRSWRPAASGPSRSRSARLRTGRCCGRGSSSSMYTRSGMAGCTRCPMGASLVDSYHCSRYNTQTGRLTAEMFAAVLARALALSRED